MKSTAVLLCATLFAACAGGGDVDTDETSASDSLDGKTDASDDLSVRAGDTTLWVGRTLTVRDGATGREVVMRGRTSRTLTDGNGFVIDDVYGDFAKVSARVFELTWPVSTLRTLTDGVDQLVAMSFVHSSSRPDSLTARAVVRPVLADFTGSSKIYLVQKLVPVVVAGDVAYRISGHTYGANTEVRLVVDNVDVGAVTRTTDEQFAIDLAPQQALAWLSSGAELQVIAMFPTGGVDKRVHLGLALDKLGMTTGDAEAVWPRPTCTTATRTCLLALPDDALDLGSCGEALRVNACAQDVGVAVDDTSFQASLHAAEAQLAAPAARADAIALVGDDHADAFLYGAQQTVETELEHSYGRWFLSAATRDAQLANAVTRGFDRSNARPLDFVDPHAAQPGNIAAMRQVAADAVLTELARMDFLHTEFSRTLEDLTHQFRIQHLSDINAFRTTVSAEPYMTAKDVYVGSWLGLHTEVVVDRATGTVDSTLVEID